MAEAVHRRDVPPRLSAALALFGSWLLFFGTRLLDADGVPYSRDLARVYIPIRYFLHDALRHGRLPEWFPYDVIGTPFIGQIVTATFHPETWLLLPFSPLTAVKLNVLLAYLVGLIGAYRFARLLPAGRVASVTAAISLAFGGYALGVHNNLPYLMGQVTLPWVGWAALSVVRRQRWKDVALLGVTWALLFLGGDAQGAAMAVVLVFGCLVAYGINRRRMLLLAAGGGLAGLLASVELLPATSAFGGGSRFALDLSERAGSQWALHPWRLLELFIPGFVPDAQMSLVAQGLFHGDHPELWSTTIFAGGIALCLAALALAKRDRRALSFAGVLLFALWMSLGLRGKLWGAVTTIIPLLRHFAYPEKYLALFMAALTPLVALGFEQATANPIRALKVFGAFAVSAAVLAACIHQVDLTSIAFARAGHPFASGDPAHDALLAAWTEGTTTTSLLALSAAALLGFARRRPSLVLGLPVLLFAEFWHGNSDHLPLASREAFDPSALEQKVLTSSLRGPPPRVFSTGGPPGWTSGMNHDPDLYVRGMVTGLRSMVPAIQGIAVTAQNQLPAIPARIVPVVGPNAIGWSTAVGACWRVAEPPGVLTPGERIVAQDDDFGVVLISRPCAPYVRVAGSITEPTFGDVVQAFSKGLPPDMIAWENGPALPSSPGRATLRDYQPGHIVVDTEVAHPSALVVTETFTDGWAATIDGRPAPLHPANLTSLGVEVPEGKHSVIFAYHTPRLALGAILSLIGIALTGLGLMRRGPYSVQ